MVYGTQRAYMPMSNGTLHTGRRQHIHGSGSSYSSMDDYIATTHSIGGSIGKKVYRV